MKKLLIGMAVAALVSTAATAQTPNLQPDARFVTPYTPAPGETAFDFNLKGYVFGIKMIKARYKGHFGNDTYAAYSDLKTSGLGALLKKLRIWAVTEGRYDRTGLYPVRHTQQNLDKKSRRVEMAYDYRARKVSVDINPPIGSQGIPPATPKERFEADDTISAILGMMMSGYTLDRNVCEGTVKVFDSKQHYGLRMARAGTKRVKVDGKKINTIKCHVYYEPISGFDPEDLPDAEEGGTPVNVYFMDHKDAGLYVPVRFTYKISGFKAVIKLSDLNIVKR